MFLNLFFAQIAKESTMTAKREELSTHVDIQDAFHVSLETVHALYVRVCIRASHWFYLFLLVFVGQNVSFNFTR